MAMQRGEVWIMVGPDYLGKPRPVVILQSDAFAELDSVTVCLVTSEPPPAPMPLLRVALPASAETGLRVDSWAMIDKITTTSRDKMGYRIGRVSRADLVRIVALAVSFLGGDISHR